MNFETGPCLLLVRHPEGDTGPRLYTLHAAKSWANQEMIRFPPRRTGQRDGARSRGRV